MLLEHYFGTLQTQPKKNAQFGVVKTINVPDQYISATDGYDIAVLTLNKALSSTEYVRKTELQQSDDWISNVTEIIHWPQLANATLAGWGEDKTNNYDKLHYVNLKTFRHGICDIYPDETFELPNDTFCSIRKNMSLGDLGGPLFRLRYDIQIGILSNFPTKRGNISVFTDVAAHADWIAQIIDSSPAPNQMSILVHIFTFVSAYFLI